MWILEHLGEAAEFGIYLYSGRFAGYDRWIGLSIAFGIGVRGWVETFEVFSIVGRRKYRVGG